MVIYVGGDKGGTGKSLTAMLAVWYFLSYYHKHGKRPEDRPILIETDGSNGDVYRAYENERDVDRIKVNADKIRGWEAIIDIVDSAGERPVVINSGARNTEAVAAFGEMLEGLEGITVFWVINDQRDSVDLLGKFLSVIPSPAVVVKNGLFGDDSDFEAFNKSGYAREGMKSVMLPEASKSLMDCMYSRGIPLHRISEAPDISKGRKAAAKLWAKKVSGLIPEAIRGALGDNAPETARYAEPADITAFASGNQDEGAGMSPKTDAEDAA